MATIDLFGQSDDLIEIEGTLREEFSANDDDEGNIVAFSDGTIVRVEYDRDGVWRIVPITMGPAFSTVVHANMEDDNPTDHLHMDGPVVWVVHGKTWHFIFAKEDHV